MMRDKAEKEQHETSWEKYLTLATIKVVYNTYLIRLQKFCD
jgi:hypothetical protein